METRGFGSIQSPGSCELPDVCAETQIQVLCAKFRSSALLAAEPYLQVIEVPGWPGTRDPASSTLHHSPSSVPPQSAACCLNLNFVSGL